MATAITGRTSIVGEPAQRKTGAKMQPCPEASSQTYPRGALLIKSAGFVNMHTTSFVSVSLYGLAARSGRNGTADGDKNANVWRFQADQPFKMAMSGTFTATNRGATAALSQNTAGVCFLVTASSASDSSVVRIIDAVPPFTVGDVNPVVYFVPLTAKIQEG